MKCIKKIFLTIALIYVNTVFSQVTLPHYDGLDYTAGQSLSTQIGWTSLYSGDDLLITSGNLSYPGFGAPDGNKISFDGAGIDAAKLFTQQTTGTVYYSFLCDVTNRGGLNSTGGYFSGFTEGVSASFGGTVWLKKLGEGFTIGLNIRTTIANTIWLTDTLSVHETMLIVVSYELVAGTTNDITQLWLNPDASFFGGVAPTPDIIFTNTSENDLTNLNQILIRQDDAASTPFIELDELRIGTTWADVTPPTGSAAMFTLLPTGLIDFSYKVGSGPSASQSYSFAGSNLDGSDVLVTAPIDFEISSNGGSSWNTTLTFSGYGISLDEIISVRLKTGLNVGDYNNELIVNSGGSSATINLSCSGTVNPIPPDQFFTEGFDYTTGQLTDAPNGTGGNVSANNWISFSGNANYIPVSSGSLAYPDYVTSAGNKIDILSPAGSAEDVYRQFTDQVVGSTTYVLFLLNVHNTTGLADNSSTIGDYFAMLLPINSTTIHLARVSIRLGTAENTFQIGLRATSSNAGAVWSSSDLAVGTTYLIVFSYQIIAGNSNDAAKLWINPILNGVETSPDLSQISNLISDPTSIARIGIRQNFTPSPSSATPNATIDEIVVAPIWPAAPLPVELTSFTGFVNNENIMLSWATATEVNNYGFEIERNTPLNPLSRGEVEGVWEKIGFVYGNGNSNSPKSYSFVDDDVSAGSFLYRLKQIDNDGKFEFSKTVEVLVIKPDAFALEQNYPNPFNPATKIKYTIPTSPQSPPSKGGEANQGWFTVLKVFDVLGNEVATLVNETQPPGNYEVEFNADKISSGIYFYRLQAGNIVETKKMILLR
jgi:hypothetical protein